MSFFKKIFALLGLNKKSVIDQFNEEFEILKVLQVKALQPNVFFEEIEPSLILSHTSKIRELLKTLFQEGCISKDANFVNYTLSNIAMQENTISSFAISYKLDMPIYSSQVAASIGEILKDIVLLMS